ncbi:MAG: hypothetical protein ACFFGZ_19135, partial [Candidatus Thorarchaeota archaeon]
QDFNSHTREAGFNASLSTHDKEVIETRFFKHRLRDVKYFEMALVRIGNEFRGHVPPLNWQIRDP